MTGWDAGMAKRCYYEVLEVDRTAGDGELKSAFRKLAMKWHPDRNPGDKACETRFKEINEAYEILKDPDKAIDIWTKENGFPRPVIEYAVKQKISVFDRNIVPDKSTVDAYTAFLKKAGLLKDNDNPKIETKFALQALKDVK